MSINSSKQPSPLRYKRPRRKMATTTTVSKRRSLVDQLSMVCLSVFDPVVPPLFGFLCRDIQLLICEYLTQEELAVISQVSRQFYQLRGLTDHLRAFIVRNPKQAGYAQKQRSLEALAVYGTRDAQLFFTELPRYVYIGRGSSFMTHLSYRGMGTAHGSAHETKYPSVTTLFIDEAPVIINWGIFPNLEELYILTSQLDLCLNSLDCCRKLRKVIVKVRKGIVYLHNPKVTELPCLEVFAVSGCLVGKHFRTCSPFLRHCVFYSLPHRYYAGIYYKINPPVDGDDEEEFERLFRTHHRPPSIINRIAT